MKSLRALLLATALLPSPGPWAADEELDVKPAMGAAQAWLATVDAGRRVNIS